MGEHIFIGAHLCKEILAVDNDLYMCYLVRINAHHSLVYHLAYSNIQQRVTQGRTVSKLHLGHKTKFAPPSAPFLQCFIFLQVNWCYACRSLVEIIFLCVLKPVFITNRVVSTVKYGILLLGFLQSSIF